MKTLRNSYENRKPDGIYSIGILGALLVFIPDDDTSGDTLITTWENSDGERGRYNRNMVHYTTSGRAYVRRNYSRYYLDEIERVR